MENKWKVVEKMKVQFIFLTIIFIFISSCDKDDLYLTNCQDINNDCYLFPLENFKSLSYSPFSIVFNIDNLEQVESLFIQRMEPYEENVSDTSFVIHKDSAGLFIDDINITLNKFYSYSARNYSELGFSDASSQINFEHDFEGINNDSLVIKPRNENSIDINWSYNIGDDFVKNYDDALWKIIRSKKIDGNENWINDYTFDYPIIIINSSDYEFYDDSNINLYDSLKYEIYLEVDDSQSDTIRRNLRVNFPQMEFINWIPVNSTAVSIHWKIDSSNNDNITSVRIINVTYDQQIYETGSDKLEDYLIDDLNDYSNTINPDTPINYMVEWCGVSACDTTNFTARTFQFKDMQYIPAMSNVVFDENNTISTEAFYIDIYEVNTNMYDVDSEQNLDINSTDFNPQTDISIDEAIAFCSDRSSTNESLLTYLDDFRLPTESEWYVAAAVKYDVINNQVQEQYNYTTQVGNGTITCAFGNILNCYGGGARTVGFYNGDNLPDYQESTSPNGLYDCNGNAKEWVRPSSGFSHPDNVDIIMSGDFQSSESHAVNNYFIYEQSDFSGHPTIGFRTVISAPPPINEAD